MGCLRTLTMYNMHTIPIKTLSRYGQPLVDFSSADHNMTKNKKYMGQMARKPRVLPLNKRYDSVYS